MAEESGPSRLEKCHVAPYVRPYRPRGVTVPFIVQYPQHSFELAAGVLITFSTTSTLIFFAFAATALLIGFDRAYHGRVVQAQPAREELGDQFVS